MGQLSFGLFSPVAMGRQTASNTNIQNTRQQTVRTVQTAQSVQSVQTVHTSRNVQTQNTAQKKRKSPVGILVLAALVLCAAIVVYTTFFLDSGSSLRNVGGNGGGGTSQVSSKTVDVETDLTKLGLNGKLTAKTGKDYTATLLPEDGWQLPMEITVKVDGTKLSAKKYDYDPETGKLTIPADQVTGDIEIIAKAEQMSITGEWVGSVDLSDLLNESIVGTDPTLEPYFNFTGLTLDINLVLTEGGMCKLSVDPASAERMMQNLRGQMANGFYAYIEDLLDEYGYTMPADEFLESMGYASMDDFMDEMFDTDEMVRELTDIGSTGKYVAKDGMLYMTDDTTTDPLKVAGNPYTLAGKKLTIRASSNTNESTSFMYPLVMKRVG